MASQNLIDANIHALKDGAELLLMLDSEQYRFGLKPAFQATIGAHYRHVIEHYRCLLGQVGEGVFCYDQRQRDEDLESDRKYALQSIADIIAQLETINVEVFDQQYLIIDHQLATPLETTLQRELLFLQSHTVHHYAIIAAMARGLGKQPMSDFGVAIATIKHRNDTNQHGIPVSGPQNQSKSAKAEQAKPTTELESDRSNACAQ